MPRLCPPGKFQRALDLLEADPDAGLEELEALARRYPKDPQVREGLGVAYLSADLPFEAVRHLEWAERKEPGPAVRRALHDTYLALGLPVHASRLVKRSGSMLAGEASYQEAIERVHGEVPAGVTTQEQLDLEQAMVAMMRRESSGVPSLQRLVDAHPGYQAAWNFLATAWFVEGDVARYAATVREAAKRAPQDVQAVLDATRAALLEGGVEAARGYRAQLDAATSHRGTANTHLARAEALAMMDDADAMEDEIEAYYQCEPETDDPDFASEVDDLVEALELRASDPRVPLVDLESLLMGALARWSTLDADEIERTAAHDLASMPGVLRELPGWIGYQQAQLARTLATLLLSKHAPPSPEAPWPEVLQRVAMEGPGTRSTRADLFMFLADVGLVEQDVAQSFAGTTDGLSLHRFELSDEAVPSGLPERDEERLSAALQDLMAGRAEAARRVLEDLQAHYPDTATVTFNLALAERSTGGEAAERAQERLEWLVEHRPDHLFPRARLAVDALEAGDVARAEELLALPEGKERFHVQEWAMFSAAQGRLALAHGDVDLAERYLAGIEQAVGDDQGAYHMLEDAIDAAVLGEPSLRPDSAKRGEAGQGLADGADPDSGDADPYGSPFQDEADAPPPEEVAALPILDDAWFVAVAPVAFMIGEEPEATLLWLVAVVDGDGTARALRALEDSPDGDDLYALVAGACAGAMSDAEPARPRRVVVADPLVAVDLRHALERTGIATGAGEVGPARALIEGFAESMGGSAPPWLADEDEDDAADFLEAADAFYEAEPWERIPPDGYLAVRVDEGPWRYACVMGQGGEEFGLALLDGWYELQTFAEGGATPPDEDDDDAHPLSGLGSLESLSLCAFESLSPLDGGLYLDLGFGPGPAGEAAAFLRFTSEGLARPRHGAGVYAALLRLIAKRVARVRHRVRRIDENVDTPEGRMRVLYPATGAEGADTTRS